MRPFTPEHAALAQPVEHIIRNDGVRCSSHLSGTILPKIVEKQSPTGELCVDRHTRVLHSVEAKGGLKASNHLQKQSSDCYTVVLHSRHLGLWRRGAVYQYRVRVPHSLVTVLGKREINRSLKTTSFSDAVRTVRKIAFEIETYFSEVHDLQSTCDATVPMTSDRDRSISIGVQVPASRPASATINLRTVCDLFLADPTSARTTKSTLIYRTTYAAIIDIVGAETPITSINRAVCRELFGVLQKLPANARKRFPNTSLREIADAAHAAGIPPMSTANANEVVSENWTGC